ncbi:hypothetical protein [Lentzea sp. NPDC051838]|uniref:hypothetical protein n=1 Tax=Lentzea sp. NPDC051838 TaxID=3154849 RepID=UPI0034178AFC
MDNYLTETYGRPFLDYVLATSNHGHINDLTDGQKATLKLLHNVAEAVDTEDGKDLRRVHIIHRISGYLPEHNCSVAALLRMQSGGEIPEPHHGDPLVDCMWRLARDAWPSFLIPQDENWPAFFGAMGALTFTHPAGNEAWNRILQDDSLKKLFPEYSDDPDSRGEVTEIQSSVLTSAGRGGTFQLVSLPDLILSHARMRQLIQNELSFESFLSAVAAIIADWRRLAIGRQARTPVLVGFAGITLEREVNLPQGRLRKRSEADRLLFGRQPGLGREVSVVLETTHAFKILKVAPAKEMLSNNGMTNIWKGLESKFEESRKQLDHDIDMVRFSVLMASEPTSPMAMAVVSRAMLDMTQHGSSFGTHAVSFAPYGDVHIDSARAEKIEHWAREVKDKHPGKLTLGARRLVSAVSTRTDPLDGLIDAIICWENMVGTDMETSFRVCGALACLLEPESGEERTKRFKELKSLYDTRSKLVHGSREPSYIEAQEYRSQAVGYALRAMQQLYRFPDLLSEPESAVRGTKILLTYDLSIKGSRQR